MTTDDRDTAVSLLRLRRLIERADVETRDQPPRRRRAPRLRPAGQAYAEPGAAAALAAAMGASDPDIANLPRFNIFTPEGWDGTDPAVQALIDGEEEKHRPKVRRTAAYYAVLGPAPECDAGDVGSARVYLAKILKCLELGGWTHSERVGLKRLEKLWRQRATGRDVRFLLVGNYRGRLLREDENRIRDLRLAQRRGQL